MKRFGFPEESKIVSSNDLPYLVLNCTRASFIVDADIITSFSPFVTLAIIEGKTIFTKLSLPYDLIQF